MEGKHSLTDHLLFILPAWDPTCLGSQACAEAAPELQGWGEAPLPPKVEMWLALGLLGLFPFPLLLLSLHSLVQVLLEWPDGKISTWHSLPFLPL